MVLRNCNTCAVWAQFTTMFDWEDFKYFHAVAQAGSVRGAGRDLGVHASTVTRRLEQFEQRLGVRLFARTRSGLVITPEGAQAVQALDDVASRLESVERRLKGRDASMAGLVRVNAPEVFRSELFMVNLGAFSRRHPEVIIEIGCAWQPPDLDKREGDLLVVLTDDPPGHLVGRRLGHMSLAGYGHVDTAHDLEGCWLGSALERAVAPEYIARAFPRRRIGGYLESMDLQLAAVVAGMGSTLLPRYVGDRHSQLARMEAEAEVGDLRRGIWLLSHPDSRGVVRLQAVAELLLEALRGRDLGTGLQVEGSDVD